MHSKGNKIYFVKRCILIFIVLLLFGFSTKSIAQTSSSTPQYVPLVGVIVVPNPLTLPNGGGNVTYYYTVKNFTPGVTLSNVQISDSVCSHINLITIGATNESQLNYNSVLRYVCTTKISTTTQNVVTVTANTNGIGVTHNAYATVVVGSNILPPLVNVVDITKIAYPISLPARGGPVTFTYRVTNPGVAPLSDVLITDNTCSSMSHELGDTNGNNLLDPNEIWIYTCTTNVQQTTTNTVTVTAVANGLKATDNDTVTVYVATSSNQLSPNFPAGGLNPNLNSHVAVTVWEILSGILLTLIIIFVVIRKK